MKLKHTLLFCFLAAMFSLTFFPMSSCNKSQEKAPSQEAVKFSRILEKNHITLSPEEIQNALDRPAFRSSEACPPEAYQSPHGFAHPLGDSCHISQYRVIRRVISGDTAYCFGTADLLNFFSQYDQAVTYSPYDLARDNFITTADLIALIPWYGADPIDEIDLELFEIGLNYDGEVEVYSSGLGLFYHQEMLPIVVDSTQYPLPDYGIGQTNGFLFPSMGDETEAYSCWNSAELVLYGAPQYTMVK